MDESTFEMFEEDLRSSQQEPPHKPIRHVRCADTQSLKKMKEHDPPSPQPAPKVVHQLSRGASLRRALSIQSLSQIEAPWKGITLNRCLMLAIIILLIGTGFHRLYEVLEAWSSEGDPNIPEPHDVCLRHITVKQGDSLQAESSLWENRFWNWILDDDDEDTRHDEEENLKESSERKDDEKRHAHRSELSLKHKKATKKKDDDERHAQRSEVSLKHKKATKTKDDDERHAQRSEVSLKHKKATKKKDDDERHAQRSELSLKHKAATKKKDDDDERRAHRSEVPLTHKRAPRKDNDDDERRAHRSEVPFKHKRAPEKKDLGTQEERLSYRQDGEKKGRHEKGDVLREIVKGQRDREKEDKGHGLKKDNETPRAKWQKAEGHKQGKHQEELPKVKKVSIREHRYSL